MATKRKKYTDWGRPCNYTEELGLKVCEIISTHSQGLDRLNQMYDFFPDKAQIFRWVFRNPNFRNQYFEARRLQSHILADDIISLADSIPVFEDEKGVDRIDSGMLGRGRLEFECKKWHASKMEPKIYGDHKQIEDLTGQNESLMSELRVLRQQLDDKNKKEY